MGNDHISGKTRRWNGGSSKRKLKGYFFLLPALILIVVFSYYPFVKTIILSFFTINANNEVVAFAGLKNYTKVVADAEFWQSVKNTVRYTLITVPVTLALAYFFAMLCCKTRRLSRFYETCLALPMAVSMSVATTIFNLMLNPNIGPVNHYLNLNVGWLTDKNVMVYTLCMIGIWLHVGMAFIFLLAAVRNVPEDLLESARLDGASVWAQVINVYIPLTSPTLFYLLATNLASSMMMSDLVIALTQGGTSNSATSTMIYYMYRKAFYIYNYGSAYASAVLAFIIAFGVLLLSFVLERKKVHYS
ncbi:carbohydrate ABC transporter permease [Lacrimispora sp. 210928-DFI.3.58]|uniref:carbohydrate ABC transporter permease n=1 Tax=Lacrimispora sp. 210928-DFI.3.58 TaxID=2883214 RepID=UPI001D05DC96|nr:sugar ABC transporter permease [Lacrimispora sp. 210928-DFI.3.58]MCB7318797.1 sugar ABC transporter permease [Lacrimispora sp. 210928-DFI.3.58]